jgi:pyridoxal phosphate enzyme (YggS family)
VIDSAALTARLASVRDRVARAAGRARRDPASIRIVAVSKTFTAEHVRAAAAAGQLDFGENKVQEGLQKIAQTADLQIRWHLVGHLQSNKARKACARFDVIHSVDAAALLGKLDEAAQAEGRTVELLVQVDLAGEATKHGAREDGLAAIFDAARGCHAARLVGLMLLPPATDDPERARPYFRALRDVRDRLMAGGVDGSMVHELSMGMSHDFEVAIEEGATLVRVGTAIFGERTYV